MSKDFTNLDDLFKYVKNNISQSMDSVGKVAKEKVKNQIDEDVYRHTPTSYQRTYELRDSIQDKKILESANEVVVEISHDTNNIHPYSPNQHMSVVTGDSSAAYIPVIVHDGKSGMIFGEGYWTEPRPYMDNAKEEIEQENLHVNTLIHELKKRGIDVKVD